MGATSSGAWNQFSSFAIVFHGGTDVLPNRFPTSKLRGLLVRHLLCPFDRILVRIAGERSEVSKLPSAPMTVGARYFAIPSLNACFYLVGLVRCSQHLVIAATRLTSYAGLDLYKLLSSTASRRRPCGSICACSRRRFRFVGQDALLRVEFV